MPFDFKAYDQKCNGLTPEELQREWQHYTRLISGASTSTAISGIAVPLTMGVSTIGVAMAAPAIHNARKKRAIIEKHLQKHNTSHVTRKRDVLGSMAVSGTIGLVTMGVGGMGADAVATAGAEHGISAVVENEVAIKVVTHAAMDGIGFGVEHAHTSHLKKRDAFKAFKAAGVFEAVKDAKAAEAGYSIQPYNPQNFTPGGNMGQMSSPPPPPPPYSPGSQRPSTYHGTSGYGYAPDSKGQTTCVQGTYDNQYISSGNTGQYPFPQPSDPNQVQHQHNFQGDNTSTSISEFLGHPGQSHFAYGATTPYNQQAHRSFPSPAASNHPQTPVQQDQQVQPYQPQHPHDQYDAANTQSRELPPTLSATSIYGAYDMNVMVESLSMMGTDTSMAHERQKRQSITRKPVPRSPREEQSQVTQTQSPQATSQPGNYSEGFHNQSRTQSPGTPQPFATQAESNVAQSGSSQSLERPQCAPQPSSQFGPSNEEDQVDISSLCGLDLTAPPSTRSQGSTIHYGEIRMQPSSAVKQQLAQQGLERSMQETPKEKQAVQPETVQQQHYPSYAVQQQTGLSGAPQVQQAPSSAGQSARYSLQAPLAPSPLPTPSLQFTPGQPQPQGIPYFPPPPGQPQNAPYNPATFPQLPAQPSSYAQPHTHNAGQKGYYTTPEVQYPPVPIPGPYSPVAARPTSFYGQMVSPDQLSVHIPVQSKPQQYPPPMQYHMAGYPQMPLTPPYSPPQNVQHTSSSYFSAGTSSQYQSMYPAYTQ